MNDSVLIDTSAWVQLLRDGKGRAADWTGKLLRAGAAHISSPIATELIRGAAGKKELSALEDLFSVVGWLRTSQGTYKEAGLMGFTLARKGISIATVDLILAQVAIENRAPMLTLDRHFSLIAMHFPLELVSLAQEGG